MRRIFLFAMVGFGSFLFFLVTKAPAGLLLHALPENANLNMEAPSGTLWNGRVAQVQAGPLRFGPVEWDVSALHLLMLRVNATVDASLDGGRASAQLILHPNGRLHIREAIGQSLPLSRLTPLFDQSPGNVQGTLAFDFPEVTIRKQQPWSGKGQIRLFDLEANLMGPVELGNFGGDVSGTEGEFLIDFHDAGEPSPFAIQGQLAYHGDEQQYMVNGRIRARVNAPDNLARGLRYLGDEDSEGYYPLRFNGRL